MRATELFQGLMALPGARDAGGQGADLAESVLVSGIEYARATAVEERRLRAAWKRREQGKATPLVLLADDPDSDRPGFVRALGPERDGPLRRVRCESLLDLVRRTVSMSRPHAVRLIAEELDRLDAERLAGLRVRGLGTEHLYDERLPKSERWPQLQELVEGVSRSGWKELLTDLGYTIEQLKGSGYLARFKGRPMIVVHPRAHAWMFARLDEDGRLPEGALVARCRDLGAPFGILAAGARLRLLAAAPEDAGVTTSYLELDATALEPERRALLGLFAPAYLAEGGLREVLADARDHGQKLRLRLDRVLRQEVLPSLGLELGRWARREGRDLAEDGVREELEGAALLFVFRALFLLYAESAGHLPMVNPTYNAKSLTRVCERAEQESDKLDPVAGSLWDDITLLVRRMRTGQQAWGLPAYNGDLFAADAVSGAPVLEQASIPDAALAPALVALGRDNEEAESVGIDFSNLEIGHLGYIYEGLLSLRLSLADRDYSYDARSDRYVAPKQDAEPDIRAGDLLWLTNEGGRKSGGVYYTRTELVRHLVRGAVGPAFERHLQEVRELAVENPEAAAEKLFDFYVLDPACGSAHFLVEVVDELADQLAALLGELSLPAVRSQLDDLRAKAAAYVSGIEDTGLLKRLVLKRCVYGVDLSTMGVEIAKVSLWLSTFVPGLSLAYLDHNVQRGNSLIGVAGTGAVVEEGTLFANALSGEIERAALAAVEVQAIDDATPDLVKASHVANSRLREQESGVQRLFNLWTAEPFGVPGARSEAVDRWEEVLSRGNTPSATESDALAEREHFLHWPMAFPEVFARERPGFDAVVGNPPWEEVTIEELAFYARYRPGLRALSQVARGPVIAQLLAERPELAGGLEDTGLRMAALRRYFSESGDFKTTTGDPDTYKLFCQRYRQLVRDGGAIGVVLPRSVFLARGSAHFRDWLFNYAAPERIDFLLNNRSWAFDIHPQYSVALLIARRGATRDDIEVAGIASSAVEFTNQIECPGVRLRRDALGGQLEIPLLPSQAAANLLAKVRSVGPITLGDGHWRCFPVRELDETNHAYLWRGATSGRPLWKGESFDQYDPHGAGQRFCPASDAAMAKVLKSRPGGDSLVAQVTSVKERRDAVARATERARVAFRDVSRATDSRTVRACLVPPLHFLTNTAPYLLFVDDDPTAEALCLAILNSLVFDWQARRFVEIHLNFFVLESLNVPRIDGATVTALSVDAARLSCIDERFADFAKATGVECGPLPEHEREALRADIDARVARAWDLTKNELEVVFSDFTLDAVPENYRERVRVRFAELGKQK
ncbi:MAG: Eco57I restriction-modification methylase domain-containing protein [Solirubrobacteraceae bacterium]